MPVEIAVLLPSQFGQNLTVATVSLRAANFQRSMMLEAPLCYGQMNGKSPGQLSFLA